VDTETPRPEKLVLDFDTTVNSSPTDISGQGNHGVFYNGASYSAADKAFKFDGSSNQYIQGNLNNTGDIDFSISTWLRRDTFSEGGFPFSIGTISGAGTGMAFDIYASGGSLYFWVNGGTMLHDTDGATQFPAKTWVHVVATRTGTTLKVYLNGVDWTSNMAVSSNGSAALSLPANAIISLGRREGSANTDFTGQISNFKVYNVVLEPSEVRKLYNLGRTGRSMVISDTAVGIGKVPEAQLDVRGTFRAPGTIVQVMSVTKTDTFVTTGANNHPVSPGNDVPGLSVTIHPKFANSKILISYDVNMGAYGRSYLRIQRKQGGSTTNIEAPVGPEANTQNQGKSTSSYAGGADSQLFSASFAHYDTAGSTTPITYTIQAWTYHSTYYVYINRARLDGNGSNNGTYWGRTLSSITAQEVCQ
jgi:hypothetical protein